MYKVIVVKPRRTLQKMYLSFSENIHNFKKIKSKMQSFHFLQLSQQSALIQSNKSQVLNQNSLSHSESSKHYPFDSFFPRIIVLQYLNMSKKNVTFRNELESSPQNSPPRPQTIRFKNLANHPESADIASLRLRIDDLESKVAQLEIKMRSKRKRIRRKSCEVQKKHRCEFCKKLYGSIVSLNLHLRIKHRKQKQEMDKNKEAEGEKSEEKIEK